MKTKVIIVDDEKNARLALRGILEENFPEIAIAEECKNVPEAVKAIHKHKPEIVFLDISMPGYSGIDLFQFFSEGQINFKVVFVTAYSEYAINAFELSAVDYLLKPVRIEALRRAIQKANLNHTDKIKALQTNIEQPNQKKIALQTGGGILFLELNQILYLKADGSYTHFITAEGRKITVTKRISEYERLEEIGNFLRIHRSHIINLNSVKKIVKQDGGNVVMEDGEVLSISNEKKKQLLEKIEGYRL